MDKSPLGIRLKKIRLAHGVKQAEIAAILDIAQQTYSSYENGRRTPGYDILYKLANYYNISVDELICQTVDLDENLYYGQSSDSRSNRNFSDFFEFINAPENRKKYKLLDRNEKEMLFYFEQLNSNDKEELVAFAKLKLMLHSGEKQFP